MGTGDRANRHIIYSGNLFSAWRGYAVIGGLQSHGIVLVDLTGAHAVGAGRADFAARIRSIGQSPTGEIWAEAACPLPTEAV